MEKKNREPIHCYCKECIKEYSVKIGKNKLFKPKQYTMFAYWEMEGKL